MSEFDKLLQKEVAKQTKTQGRRKTTVVAVKPAGENHQVISLKSNGEGTLVHRVKPCAQCPWRTDQDGSFPAEAFRHSAPTSYDMAGSTFACHMSGSKAPATCAGFLLKCHHNLSVRLRGRDIHWDKLSDGGHALHDSYRAMAEANGVDPEDPVLKACR